MGLSRSWILFKQNSVGITVQQSTFSSTFQIFSEQRRSDCWECEPVCAGDDDCCSWYSVCDSLLYANTDCGAPHSGREDDEGDWNCYG